MKCQSCMNIKKNYRTAYLNGIYYRRICDDCVALVDPGVSGSVAGFERRRQYEDHAQDTVQPYTASGPNPEFYRLYPDKAPKVFTKSEIEQVKRKL